MCIRDRDKMFLSSADMMTRNMIKRVEILFPVNDRRFVEELKDINALYLADNKKARFQKPDGTYAYVKNDLPLISAQEELMRRALKVNREQIEEKENYLLTRIRNRFKKNS